VMQTQYTTIILCPLFYHKTLTAVNLTQNTTIKLYYYSLFDYF
jgi:hypothetical protein